MFRDYQQIGVLINQNSEKDDLLPLFGKPTYPGSRLWYYYTRTNTYNPVKIAVVSKDKDCQNEYGCEQINNGEDIKTIANDNVYKVNLYNYDKPRYIPHIY